MRTNITVDWDEDMFDNDLGEALFQNEYEHEVVVENLGDGEVVKLPDSGNMLPVRSMLSACEEGIPVFMSHSGERSEENPFSHISTVSTGVVVGYDSQNQPYIYDYHWTAEQADMAEEDWERMRRENRCLYIGWGFGDHEKSKLDCTEKGNQ